ncbi:MAG: DUF433 domain-containing protein [Acidobacteriales bacterium]|nr:DUF433 domain-containing protein [Terriglobales bacterium]
MLASSFGGVSEVYRLRAAKYRSDVDPRELPVYTPADAAEFLGIKKTTLHRWLFGTSRFAPVIEVADPGNRLLSFFNLAEAHVLAATRYKHHVSFRAIRTAIETLNNKYPAQHPLISKDFVTNGIDIFLQSVSENENLSTPGQTNLKSIMDMFLVHVGRDTRQIANRIDPVIKGQPADGVITIVHGVASGQPIIKGYGVPVFVIYGRHEAGEDHKQIARDFRMPVSRVKRAIQYVEKRSPQEKRAA